jgi:hypothetical protein
MDQIELFIAARRNLIALWTAKQRLLSAAQARFPKSYPVFKAILKVCHNDPTCQIRFLADKSACQCADRFGDEIFRKEVDGHKLPAVTHWFYGISHNLPEERVGLERTKAFSAADIERFEEVGRRARRFIDSVSALPFVSAMELTREARKFDQCYTKAQAQVEKSSPLYTAYLCLHDRLPPGVIDTVIDFSE